MLHQSVLSLNIYMPKWIFQRYILNCRWNESVQRNVWCTTKSYENSKKKIEKHRFAIKLKLSTFRCGQWWFQWKFKSRIHKATAYVSAYKPDYSSGHVYSLDSNRITFTKSQWKRHKNNEWGKLSVRFNTP